MSQGDFLFSRWRPYPLFVVRGGREHQQPLLPPYHSNCNFILTPIAPPPPQLPRELFTTGTMSRAIAGQLGICGYKPSVLGDILAGGGGTWLHACTRSHAWQGRRGRRLPVSWAYAAASGQSSGTAWQVGGAHGRMRRRSRSTQGGRAFQSASSL